MLFLGEQIKLNKTENLLQRYLWDMLSSEEVMCSMISRAIFQIKVIKPLRFFTNSNEIGFGPTDMSKVLDPLYEFLLKVSEDGSLMFDPDLDIFESAKFSDSQKLAYDDYLLYDSGQMGKTVNGKERVSTYQLILKSLYEAETLKSDSAYDFLMDMLKFHAQGFLRGMSSNDTPMKDYITQLGGKFSHLLASDTVKEDLKHSLTNSDSCESYFGLLKFCLKRWRNIDPGT